MKFKINLLARRFVKEQKGAYSIIMSGATFVLLLIVGMTVDGTGMLLERARLGDSLEQASLALTAENVAYRKDEYRKSVEKEEGEAYSEADKYNRRLIEQYIATYLPNIKDSEYDYSCELDADNSVICGITGSVTSASWFPIADLPKNYDVANRGKAKKEVRYATPLDLMFVTDLSASMVNDLNNKQCNGGCGTNSKLASLKRVLKSFTDIMYPEENASPLHRIGITSFSFGTQENGDENREYCVFPYKLNANADTTIIVPPVFTNTYNTVLSQVKRILVKNINFASTLDDIATFNGNKKSYTLRFHRQKGPNEAGQTVVYSKHNGLACFTGDDITPYDNIVTKSWFNKDSKTEFTSFANALQARGGTFSSSGMLVAANTMMQENADTVPSVAKSNTLRMMVILSDGKDETYAAETSAEEMEFRAITNKLIYGGKESDTANLKNGMCEKIRNRLDSLQDSAYDKVPSQLVFIAFGYTPSNSGMWKDCVGKENYYEAHSEIALLETLRSLVEGVLNEEVGKSITY